MNSVVRGISGRLLLSACVTLMAGCAESEPEFEAIEDDASENVGASEDAIRGGVAADQFSRERSVSLGFNTTSGIAMYCTGTIIGPRHILTASHCVPQAGDRAFFYTTTDPDYVPVNTGVYRDINAVYTRPGVNAENDDFTDSNGEFADIAVLRLSADIPSSSRVATMAWTYPVGGDDWGNKVGRGRHEGAANADSDLRQVPDQTYSDNDHDGHFLTENEQADPGDSGGAFFYSSRVLGVLYGLVFEWEWRNKYTSVQHHLPWILSVMSYTFSGTVSSNRVVNGTPLSSPNAGTSAECSYICDKTSSCVAFNFTPAYPAPICQLKASVTGTSSQSGTTSGIK